MTRSATKRPQLSMPWRHGVYDLSEPLDGCMSIIVFHDDSMNYVYELAGAHAGRMLLSHECDEPDDAVRELGYWVVI